LAPIVMYFLLCNWFHLNDSPIIIHLSCDDARYPAVHYTLSLHDALPIYLQQANNPPPLPPRRPKGPPPKPPTVSVVSATSVTLRSEEHTSELQSRFDLVCRLLLDQNKDVHIFRTYCGVDKRSVYMSNHYG